MMLEYSLVLCSFLSVTWASNYCICTRHVETDAFPCMDTHGWPSSYLYGEIPDEDCMPVVPNVITKHDWKAGILYGQVVYVQQDHNVETRSCNKVPIGPFTYDKSCPPNMKPGTHLNPTTAPTSSSTTTTTTTTTTTPTPTTTPSTTSTTTASTTSTTQKVLASVPVHVLASNKCLLPKILHRLTTKTPASHPQAKLCNDQTRRGPDALLMEVCLNANPNPLVWKKELKVIDHCYNIPKGEPITVYIGPNPLGIYALFWRCVGGTGFEIMYQACGSAPVIENAVNKFQVDLFYTISW